jgi:hypothetical protein
VEPALAVRQEVELKRVVVSMVPLAVVLSQVSEVVAVEPRLVVGQTAEVP